MLFRKGEKRAAQEFYINFGDFGYGQWQPKHANAAYLWFLSMQEGSRGGASILHEHARSGPRHGRHGTASRGAKVYQHVRGGLLIVCLLYAVSFYVDSVAVVGTLMRTQSALGPRTPPGPLSSSISARSSQYAVILLGRSSFILLASRPVRTVIKLNFPLQGAGKHWHRSSHIVSLLTLQLKELREQTQTDADGLLLLESGHSCVALFAEIMAHHKDSSTMLDDFPLLREYVELLLHSRLAMKVLSIWKRSQLKVQIQ